MHIVKILVPACPDCLFLSFFMSALWAALPEKNGVDLLLCYVMLCYKRFVVRISCLVSQLTLALQSNYCKFIYTRAMWFDPLDDRHFKLVAALSGESGAQTLGSRPQPLSTAFCGRDSCKNRWVLKRRDDGVVNPNAMRFDVHEIFALGICGTKEFHFPQFVHREKMTNWLYFIHYSILWKLIKQ